MKEQQTRNILWAAFITLVLIIALQNIIIFLELEGNTAQVTADANVQLCINKPPYWPNNITCNNAYTNSPYTCNVSANDIDGHNVTHYWGSMLTGNTNGSNLFNNISNQGILQFTPNTNQTGNYTIQITAGDDHPQNCSLNATNTINITIEHSDGAPVLTRPIPNSTWDQDTILIPYNLNNYYVDPEGGPLLYRATGNTEIAITISPAGEVTLTPAGGFCGEEIIYYTATDIQNQSTNSNQVTLTVNCDEDEDDQGDDQGSGGGGGGGGGGGLSSTCYETYYCYDWTSCQYSKAVTDTGEKLTLNITGTAGSRIYLLEEPLDPDENISIFYSGYRWKECIDTNNCNLKTKFYVKACNYTPSCDDGIQNQDETGIDCGGICRPCGSCTDGVQNGYEEGIDCGGPDCPACYSCTDSIMNGYELGVDCGGPDCPACATCFDGIQNGGETGVDCGGPCEPCTRIEEPGDTEESMLTYFLLGGVIAALFLVLLTLLLRRLIRSWLAAMALRYKKFNRIILIDHDTRIDLLTKARELENALGSEDMLRWQAHFARLVREFYQAALGIPREATTQDLAKAIEEAHLHELLPPVLTSFFATAQSVEFTEQKMPLIFLRGLLAEFRSVVDFTAVFTSQDMKVREETHVKYPQVHAHQSLLDQIYTSFYSGELALEYDNILVAEQNYTLLHHLYHELEDDDSRHHVHPHLERFYAEWRLATYLDNSFWQKRH